MITQGLLASYKSSPVFPATGLISYYKLDTNWNDSLWVNNMTEANTSYVAGKISNGASFNGSTSTMRNGNITLPTGTSPYSVNFWVKLNAEIASWIWTLSYLWPDATNQDTQYSIDYEYNGGTRRLAMQHYYNWPETYYPIYSNQTLWTSNWTMITATYSGSSMKLYVNGTQVSSWWGGGTYGSNAAQTYQKWLTIWTQYVLSVYQQKSNSIIDEYWIWNREITSTEVSTLYNSGNWITY